MLFYFWSIPLGGMIVTDTPDPPKDEEGRIITYDTWDVLELRDWDEAVYIASK